MTDNKIDICCVHEAEISNLMAGKNIELKTQQVENEHGNHMKRGCVYIKKWHFI